VAAFAALRDTRFRPVSASELGALDYEISVLSPMRRVLDVKEIRVGQHGLIMKRGEIEGLLLPQVPVEAKWDRATFLDETCYKAGLPKNCWQSADTDIFRFTALVFPAPNEPPSPPGPGSPSTPAPPF
jgi:AmmeMemoRadiSam system protein A